MTLPSVANGSAYAPYFVSGGTLLSGEVETTVKPLPITVKTSDIVDSTGISGTVEGINYRISLLK